MLPGVDRPALAADRSRPGTGRRCCSTSARASSAAPPHLLQFAHHGRGLRAAWLLGVDAPRVGLLSIGEEESKGNELTREAHRLLKAAPLQLHRQHRGARHVLRGDADVIVCDGFTGNVALKISEGLVETVETLLGEELSSTFSSQVGLSAVARAPSAASASAVDYSEYGGAPLLGVSRARASSATAGRRPRPCATRWPWRRGSPPTESWQRVEREIAVADGWRTR